MKFEPFLTRFESLLDRAFLRGNTEVFGTSSSVPLALLFSQSHNQKLWQRPNLIITESLEQALAFQQNYSFFLPDEASSFKKNILLLPAFDVSPYSGFSPSRKCLSQRLQWLYYAKHDPFNSIFIAPIDGLIQKTLPEDKLPRHCFKVQEDLPPKFNELLVRLGYQPVPIVEDPGTYAIRGGIVDIYSAAHDLPIRLELFGDAIDSIRFFEPETQRTLRELKQFELPPNREILFSDEAQELFFQRLNAQELKSTAEAKELAHSVRTSHYFQGIDFYLPYFYKQTSSPISFFSSPLNIWHLNHIETLRIHDEFLARLKGERASLETTLLPEVSELYENYESLSPTQGSSHIYLSNLQIHSEDQEHFETDAIEYPTSTPTRVTNSSDFKHLAEEVHFGIRKYKDDGLRVVISARTQSQVHRLTALFTRAGFKVLEVLENEPFSASWVEQQDHSVETIHIVGRPVSESIMLKEDRLVFFTEDDFFEKKFRKSQAKKTSPETEVKALKFGDLHIGDYVVHINHGVGIYEGLAVMEIDGVSNEFIQIRYKDDDKLYLPIYRIGQVQRYSAPTATHALDKLGGTAWKKLSIKVRSDLKEVAAELLNLYAKRSQIERPPYPPPDEEFRAFEAFFPFPETDDQLKAIDDVLSDLQKSRPMDRLICGDVGFGKTEVAMRAAFKVIQAGKQVAVLVPTTTLAFQHLDTFKKRFRKWPISIGGLSRLTTPGESKKVLSSLADGKLDLVIGTHRLFGKDVSIKNLGLLVVDEEQKFGVTHKEKIRKLRAHVDTLVLSATPIPRTLNMSLVGIRDLSLINTPPQDRLPTRTFIVKHNSEMIRKAIYSEIQRGGQVYFVHNRVQSIHGVLDELKQIVPDARIRIGHGQMQEAELEKTILDFFNHEFDVLLCTTIIESGIDVPRANTMIIDRADTFGLSQLYQLRGRVGRSQERAYCYLVIPSNLKIDKLAQERLKVLQENTALGSGIRIAQYDLELRGAGDILGEDQSGHINAVGYDLYLELLEEALRDIRGEPTEQNRIEPEINLRIPAFIPDSYIPDIRVRLAFYKMLSDARAPEQIDRIEEDLSDRFGSPPEQVMNLLGVMLIRQLCQELAIKDISVGPKNLILVFAETTPIKAEKIIPFATHPSKKYQIKPNNRLMIRLEKFDWLEIYGELQILRDYK